MSSLLDLVTGTLDSSTIQQLGSRIGASPAQTGAAVNAAVPLLLGALHQNSSSATGASALLGALDRDHDGSILDDLAGFLGQGPSAAGARSVDHIFGDRSTPVQNAVGQASGLDSGQVMQLLAMLAPLLLGMLGRAHQQAPAPAGGAGTGGGLGDLLGGAMGKLQQQSPGLGGLLGGLLGGGAISGAGGLIEQGLGGAGGGLGDLLGGLLGDRR